MNELKKVQGAQVVMIKKYFWQSTNFWIALTSLLGALVVGFDSELGQKFVMEVFAVFASGGMLRNFFKENGLKFDWTQVGTSNFWAQLGIIVTTVSGAVLPDELFNTLQEAAQAVFTQNWQALLVAMFSLATIIWNLVKDKGSKEKIKAVAA